MEGRERENERKEKVEIEGYIESYIEKVLLLELAVNLPCLYALQVAWPLTPLF